MSDKYIITKIYEKHNEVVKLFLGDFEIASVMRLIWKPDMSSAVKFDYKSEAVDFMEGLGKTETYYNIEESDEWDVDWLVY